MNNLAEMYRDVPAIQGVTRKLNIAPDNAFIEKSVHFALDLPGRKTFFENRTDQPFPPFIQEVVDVIEGAYDKHGYYNKVGIKKYRPGESSEAFSAHRDPEEYQGKIDGVEKDLCIYNATDYADFYIDGTIIPWVPGSAIEWKAGMEHLVSEPYHEVPKEYGVRIIYFFGNSNNVLQLH